MRSVSGSTRRPSTATSPFTVTRPSAISSSHTRRLPYPATARTFWRRSPSPSGTVGGGHDAQTVLQRLHHVSARHELGQRRQVGEGVESQPLEEQRRGAPEDGLTGT